MSDKTRNTVGWILQILLAAFFLMAAFPKLSGNADAIANFERWGHPGWFRILIGALEVAGAVGLLIPMTAALAAGGLSVLMLGGAWTHISHDDGAAVVIPLATLAVCLIVIGLRWPGRSR